MIAPSGDFPFTLTKGFEVRPGDSFTKFNFMAMISKKASYQ